MVDRNSKHPHIGDSAPPHDAAPRKSTNSSVKTSDASRRARNTENGSHPTSSLALDIALGVGGSTAVHHRNTGQNLPENYPCSSLYRKRTKMGGNVAFIDAEHALDPICAEALGVNIDQLYRVPSRHR